MLSRVVVPSGRWCARAPAVAVRRRLAAADLQRRHFLPTPGDLQKALEEAQRALAEAGQRAKEESERAAKVISENIPVPEQGKQALEQAQQEVLEKAQEALEKAKQEADKAAQVINETLQQAAKGQPPAFDVPISSEQKVQIAKGLEAAAEQGAQFVNAALAAAGSPARFGGGGADGATTGRPPEGATLFWSPDAPDSPFKVGRDTFIARCMTQATDACSLVPEADVEQYVDFLLASALISNNSLPQAMGRQFYMRVVRITQRAIIALISGLEGEVLGKQMRLLWQPSPLNAFRHSNAPLDPHLVKCLTQRCLGDTLSSPESLPPYLEELGLDSQPEKVEELYEDIVALSVRIMMDVGLTKQIRILGHEITVNVKPDDLLHTAPGWEVSLEEGVFGLFGEAEKERVAKEFVELAMQDPAIQMKGISVDAQKEMYASVVKVLLNLAEVALNHFRIHVAGMAFRPCLVDKEVAAPQAAAATPQEPAEAAPASGASQ